jgi:hypothetical protein
MRVRLPGLALLVLALCLGACGGEGGSTSGPADSAPKEEGPRVAPLEVSGGGSAEFHVKGGDNSIQEYGSEAETGELRRAARVVHGYFAALAREDWAGACRRLSRKMLSSISQLAAAHPKLKQKGCAPSLAMLFGEVSAAEGREASTVDAASLRYQGAQGFLIYRGAEGKAYFASLQREAGRWTVGALSPTPLS